MHFSLRYFLLSDGLNTTQSPTEARQHRKSSYIETEEVGGFVVGDKSFKSRKEGSWDKFRHAG